MMWTDRERLARLRQKSSTLVIGGSKGEGHVAWQGDPYLSPIEHVELVIGGSTIRGLLGEDSDIKLLRTYKLQYFYAAVF